MTSKPSFSCTLLRNQTYLPLLLKEMIRVEKKRIYYDIYYHSRRIIYLLCTNSYAVYCAREPEQDKNPSSWQIYQVTKLPGSSSRTWKFSKKLKKPHRDSARNALSVGPGKFSRGIVLMPGMGTQYIWPYDPFYGCFNMLCCKFTSDLIG